MSTLSLVTNRVDLESKRNDVISKDGNIKWTIFGYEGTSTSLKVVETGTSELSDAVTNLDENRIQYLYCRVIEPNSGLNKYVLINWQGEGVPQQRRSQCARHIEEVKKFLATVHVTVNASSESQISVHAIMADVTRSSGALYTKVVPIPEVLPPKPTPPVVNSPKPIINKSIVAPPPTQSPISVSDPVNVLNGTPSPNSTSSPAMRKSANYGPAVKTGTNYQRPDAKSEIQNAQNSSYWDKINEEEEERRKRDKQQQQIERLSRLSVSSAPGAGRPTSTSQPPQEVPAAVVGGETNITVTATISLPDAEEKDATDFRAKTAPATAQPQKTANPNFVMNASANKNATSVTNELVKLREEFWHIQDEEAERQRKEESRHRDEERKKLEHEAMLREIEAAKRREKAERERVDSIRAKKQFEAECDARASIQLDRRLSVTSADPGTPSQDRHSGSTGSPATSSSSNLSASPPPAPSSSASVSAGGIARDEGLERERDEEERRKRSEMMRKKRQEELGSVIAMRKASIEGSPSEPAQSDVVRRQRQDELRNLLANRATVVEAESEERERRTRADEIRRQREAEIKSIIGSSGSKDLEPDSVNRANQLRKERQEEMSHLLGPGRRESTLGSSPTGTMAGSRTSTLSSSGSGFVTGQHEITQAQYVQVQPLDGKRVSVGSKLFAEQAARLSVIEGPTADTSVAGSRSSMGPPFSGTSLSKTMQPDSLIASSISETPESAYSSVSIAPTVSTGAPSTSVYSSATVAGAEASEWGDDSIYANVGDTASAPIANPTANITPVNPPAPAATSSLVAIAQYDYEPNDKDELAFKVGDRIINIQQLDKDWWLGANDNGAVGLFPAAYVQLQA